MSATSGFLSNNLPQLSMIELELSSKLPKYELTSVLGITNDSVVLNYFKFLCNCIHFMPQTQCDLCVQFFLQSLNKHKKVNVFNNV